MKLFLIETTVILKPNDMEEVRNFLEIITTIIEGFFGAKYLKNKYPYLKKMNPLLFLILFLTFLTIFIILIGFIIRILF